MRLCLKTSEQCERESRDPFLVGFRAYRSFRNPIGLNVGRCNDRNKTSASASCHDNFRINLLLANILRAVENAHLSSDRSNRGTTFQRLYARVTAILRQFSLHCHGERKLRNTQNSGTQLCRLGKYERWKKREIVKNNIKEKRARLRSSRIPVKTTVANFPPKFPPVNIHSPRCCSVLFASLSLFWQCVNIPIVLLIRLLKSGAVLSTFE